ncbi:MAG: matrixin family metalloprotease [Deltaproteobacteria bacterium]|nr:matrixin family metalloprotease [Deltaproteobacteria bacterium]
MTLKQYIPKSVIRHLIVAFLMTIWCSTSYAYKVNKTSGGKDIKWSTSSASYRINTSGGPSGSLSAIQASMQTWNDVSTSSFTFVYGGTSSSSSCGTNDGVNRTCFNSMGSTGTLAVNTIWYYTSTGRIVDTDIEFNTDYTYETDGSSTAYDVQNIGTHEFGHSLSLADLYSSSDSEKTMYGYGSKGETKKRTLAQDDKDGITYLYPSGEPCSYSISPRYESFSNPGGTGTVSVTTSNGCAWTATSNSSWITITSGSSGSGSGTVFYSVSSKSSTSSRTGTMTIAGKTVTITQGGQQPSAVLYVNKGDSSCNGNSPCYTTIQSAIAAASAGSLIKIRAGTYAENIYFNSSNKTLQEGGESSLTTTTLMPPSVREAGDVIEEMRTIQLQREKDIEEEYFISLKPPESGQANGNCVVVDTITAPDDETCGLVWDNGYLWASEGGSATTYPGIIFKIDTAGNILSSFDAPGKSSLGSRPMGLAFDGTYLWSVDYLDDKIYELSKSGAVIGSIPAPSGISSGLAWDGTNLWVSEWFSYKIYKLNPENGQVLMSFNAPDFEEEYPYGLAWDGTHLWVSTSNGIYMLDPATGAVLESCNDSAFKYGRAYGMTWDGQYLWGGSWVSNSIIKIDVPASDTSKELTLSGGWDSTFTTQSSNTNINSLTITGGGGTVEVDRLVIE